MLNGHHRQNGFTQWVLVADLEGGKLLECTRKPPQGWCHLEEMDAIDNDWESHDLGGKKAARVSPGGSTYQNPVTQVADRRKRFAKDLAVWLEKKVKQHNIPMVEIFAPPKLRGDLRKATTARLRDRVREHDADLRSMPLSDLAKHPAIEAVAPSRMSA